MTQLMEQAVKRLTDLPESEQDLHAASILHTLESEARWDELFARSEDLFAEMAAEVRAEHEAGRTTLLDLDRDFPQD